MSLLLVTLSLSVVLCALIYKTSRGVELYEKSPKFVLYESRQILHDAGREDDAALLKMNNFSDDNAKNDNLTVKNEIFSECKSILVLTGTSITEMPIEEYVTGCVLGEMPLFFEPQALMAQCVAARTFAIRQASGFSKHKNADVCTSPACCQNFISPKKKNLGQENLKKLTDAVNATRGIIALYDGMPIEAVYHASSGSTTLSSEEVWGGRVEYLRSVDAPEGEEALEVSVKGHRVGMSQHGANLLAKEGMGYAQILKYYYSGINLGFMG